PTPSGRPSPSPRCWPPPRTRGWSARPWPAPGPGSWARSPCTCRLVPRAAPAGRAPVRCDDRPGAPAARRGTGDGRGPVAPAAHPLTAPRLNAEALGDDQVAEQTRQAIDRLEREVDLVITSVRRAGPGE